MAHDFDREAARRRRNRKRSPREAPEEIEIVQAFVNTKELEEGDRRAVDAARAGGVARPPEASRRLGGAHRGRPSPGSPRAGGIRALLRVNNGVELDTAAVARLDEASRGARIEVSFDSDGTVRFEAASPEFADVLGSLLGMVAAARFRDDWPRFKACRNGGCQAAFWDSKRTGKWCSHRCGDQVRAKAFRRTEKYKRSSGRR